jgi:hypothetical protein
LEKNRAVYVHAILATVQFRMLHVLIHKTDIVPVTLCWCAVWCVMSREEHRLWVCEGRVVRGIFIVRES